MADVSFRNVLLRSLDAETIRRLDPRPVIFELNQQIERPENTIKHLYFVETGMASMSVTFSDGSQVGVGVHGSDSVIGISALIETEPSHFWVYTQIAGHGYSTTIEAARREFYSFGRFHALALRSFQSHLVHAAQLAACNAKHNAEQRLARWLLLCADHANSSTYAMSQESFASMLGSTRPTVSLAASILKDEGLIEYSRGVIRILDVLGLEKRSCSCYGVIKKRYLAAMGESFTE